VYRRQRKLTEAEALIREALGIRPKLFGNEHLQVADSLHNLCVILGDEGKRAESEATTREMLAMHRRMLGDEHVLVADALMDVAWAIGFTGKSAEISGSRWEFAEHRMPTLDEINAAAPAGLHSASLLPCVVEPGRVAGLWIHEGHTESAGR
jgi:hypothetical protein